MVVAFADGKDGNLRVRYSRRNFIAFNLNPAGLRKVIDPGGRKSA